MTRIWIDIDALHAFQTRAVLTHDEVGRLETAVRADVESLINIARRKGVPVSGFAEGFSSSLFGGIQTSVAQQVALLREVNVAGFHLPGPDDVLDGLGAIGKGVEKGSSWLWKRATEAGKTSFDFFGDVLESVIDQRNESAIPLLLGPLWPLFNSFIRGEATAKGKATHVKTEFKDVGSVAQFMTPLRPNEVAIVHTGGNNYVVMVRGLAPTGHGPNSIPGSINTMASKNDPLTTGVLDAVDEANIPPGANIMLVGHSQGGIAAMNIAGDEAFNERYKVTHVATFGSPVDSKTTTTELNGHTQFLHVQNRADPVPLLDGVVKGKAADTYNFSHEGDKHGLASYAQEMNTGRFINNKEVQEFMQNTGQYFDYQAKKCQRYSIGYQVGITERD